MARLKEDLESMEADNGQLDPVKSLAVLYLVTPLFIFFAAFIRFEIAIPACGLIASEICKVIRLTSWRRLVKMLSLQSLYLLIFSAAWVSWMFGVSPLHPSYDWPKHFSVLNLLIATQWPPQVSLVISGDVALRYNVGWYLVPALLLKVVGAPLNQLTLVTWSTIGIFIFFVLLHRVVGRPRLSLVAPLAFVMSGSLYSIGVMLSRRFSWLDWPHWIMYSSNSISMFYVPQHALPAWLGIALLMQHESSRLVHRFTPLVASAILLWSPFSAIGITPFILAVVVRDRLYRGLLNWRSATTALLLASPVALYLTSGSGQIPHGYIGILPCTFGNSHCFNWLSYAFLLLIELGAPLAVLLSQRDKNAYLVAAAAVSLCLIPLYKIGSFNDFGMRASIPALSAISIMCANVLVNGSRRSAGAVLVILLVIIPQFYRELALPLNSADVSPDTTFENAFRADSLFLTQYFAPLPIWILR